MSLMSIPRRRRPKLVAASSALAVLALVAALGLPASAQPTPSPAPKQAVVSAKESAATKQLRLEQREFVDPQADDGTHPELTDPKNHVGETTAMRMATRQSLQKVAQAVAPTPSELAGGRWRYATPFADGFYAIHGYWLPDGRLLAMAGSANDAANFAAGTFRSFICDGLVTSCHEIVTPVDMFCSGGIVRPNGDVLIAGGTMQYGVWKGAKYLYRLARGSNTLQKLTALQVGRWYPDVVELIDGRTLIVGGIDHNGHLSDTSEVVDANTYAHHVISAKRTFPTYARLVLNVRKNLFYTGVGQGGYTDNIAPGFWDPATNKYTTVPGLGDRVNRAQAASCFVGDVRNQDMLVMGGGPTATNTTYKVKLSASSPKYVAGPTLPFKALYHSCLTLLVFGGGTANKIENANYKVAILTSINGKFRLWNNLPAGNHRLYHSVAMLLNTGDVISWGSNPNGQARSTTVLLFTPPSQLVAKPALVSIPKTIRRYSTITVKVSGGATHLTFTRPQATTHGYNPDERFMDFKIGAGGKVDLSGAWARYLPVGYDVAWAVNTHGSTDRSKWTYSNGVTVHYG
jgi:hypothetical protein